MPHSRYALVLVVALCAVLGAAAPTTTASSGGLKVLVTGNCEQTDLATAMKGKAGIASVTTYDVGAGTPTAAQLAAADIVVDTGASCGNSGYADPVTYGNRRAAYVDHGGVVLQVAYDNWDSPGVYPKGRFASDGYAPLYLGLNDNIPTYLGQLLKPKSPIVQGLGTFSTPDNTTNTLNAGATLLAKWADGRNAIAVKGRVVATSASGGDPSDYQSLVRLTVNTGAYFNAPPGTKITQAHIGASTASFRFKAIGFATGFECKLQKNGGHARFKGCPFQKKYVGLKRGTYTFKVAAVGRHGADPTPAKKLFTIAG
jgi:hypothetical protein